MRRKETTHLASDLLRIRREIIMLKTHDSLSDLEGALIKLKAYCHRSELAEDLIEPLAALTRRPPELWAATLDGAITRLMTEGGGLRPGEWFHPDLWRLWLDIKNRLATGVEKEKICRVDL